MRSWKLGKSVEMAEAQEEILEMDELELGLQQIVPGTDNSLVRDFIAGNDAAFTLLVTKYKDALTNYRVRIEIGQHSGRRMRCLASRLTALHHQHLRSVLFQRIRQRHSDNPAADDDGIPSLHRDILLCRVE